MSIDKSLKTSGALSKHRNVLKRAERIEQLQDEERWQDQQSAFGLIKVAHRKVKTGGKTKEKPAEGEGAAEGEVAVEGETPAETPADKADKK